MQGICEGEPDLVYILKDTLFVEVVCDALGTNLGCSEIGM